MSSQAPGSHDFRRACAQFPTGVAILAVTDSSGKPQGLTVNSFTSVSLDPPLVQVSVDRKNPLLDCFVESKAFVINILAATQASLSQRFSSPRIALPHARFEGVPWRQTPSGPLLEGVIASFECSLHQAVEAGDHVILIGAVRVATHTPGSPLVFFDGGYRALA